MPAGTRRFQGDGAALAARPGSTASLNRWAWWWSLRRAATRRRFRQTIRRGRRSTGGESWLGLTPNRQANRDGQAQLISAAHGNRNWQPQLMTEGPAGFADHQAHAAAAAASAASAAAAAATAAAASAAVASAAAAASDEGGELIRSDEGLERWGTRARRAPRGGPRGGPLEGVLLGSRIGPSRRPSPWARE